MVRIAVIGCGSMGVRIAGELAYHGHRVKIYDQNKDALNKVFSRLQEDRSMLQKDGLLAQENFLGQVLCMSILEEAVNDAEFVFEAVIEDMSVKKDLFERVSHLCREDAILATNTLYLDVTTVMENVHKPERCLGLRFLFPVYYIPEVEVMAGKFTSTGTIERVRAMLERMGKTMFFRSGDHPRILSEEQREERKQARLEQLKNSSGGGLYTDKNIPPLFHKGNRQPSRDDEDSILPAEMDRDCAICMARVRDCLLNPCHHMVTCHTCGKMLQERHDSCPICRIDIVDTVRVYHS
ncbi:3-hydroxybutyryl-CoA dehydrogenase-like [Babylonia areolata]|uniref:3-hydroxybutyryl-CoA dehydrogenase-like n=1 Tax=Babylonia areolata TaxID=304850 RepID=UPI003FD4B7C5